MKRILILLPIFFTLIGCDNNDPDIKQARILEGRWNLNSIEAKSVTDGLDTTWLFSDGFIEFGFSNNKDLGPITYSLTDEDIMHHDISVPSEGSIVFNSPVTEDYENGNVALMYKHTILSLSESQLVISGPISIRRGEKDYQIYGESKIVFMR